MADIYDGVKISPHIVKQLSWLYEERNDVLGEVSKIQLARYATNVDEQIKCYHDRTFIKCCKKRLKRLEKEIYMYEAILGHKIYDWIVDKGLTPNETPQTMKDGHG